MQYEIKKVDNHISGHLDWVCDIVFFEVVKCDKCLHEHKEYYTFEDTTGIVGIENAKKKAIEIIEAYEDENFDYDNINERQLNYLNVVFDNDIDKVVALGRELQLSYSELLEVVITKYDAFVVDDEEYLVLTDKEANKVERERVESVIDDCYLAEFNFEEKKSGRSNPLLQYLDKDKWIDDWCGNRGENINGYDGIELESNYNGTTYYIYRTN
jgi:hypothetical protein